MNEIPVSHATFVIERLYPTAVEHVFNAFADPAIKRQWFAEGEGFEVDSFEMDFRVGGFERARFRFSAGQPIAHGTTCGNDTVYLDIIPNQRIVLAYTMTIAGNRISSSLATTELYPASSGTSLKFTEQAAFFEGADGPTIREQGQRKLFEKLAQHLTQ